MKLSENVPVYLDEGDWGSLRSSSDLVPGSLYKAMDSHVLIASCGAEERAQEVGDPKRGLFTQALITLLRRDRVDHLRYSDVLPRLEIIPKYAEDITNPAVH